MMHSRLFINGNITINNIFKTNKQKNYKNKQTNMCLGHWAIVAPLTNESLVYF